MFSGDASDPGWLASDAPTAFAPGSPSPGVAGDDFDQRLGTSDWPSLPTALQTLTDDGESSGANLRAVDRVPESETAGDDFTAGSGDAQDPATLQTDFSQQLETIRQMLEKILAKPGSVVLD